MLTVGEKAPLFTALDKDGTSHSLSDFLGKKVILYFYPKDNTPGCTTQACDLRDTYSYFTNKGYQIIGVSKDSAKTHKNFSEKYQLPFLLLEDKDKTIISLYHAAYTKKLFGKEVSATRRMTIVIDENGIISHILEKVNAKTHIQDLKKALNLND